MNQILRGLPMTIIGDGNQTRAFSYIADAATVMAEAIEVKGACNRVFNIGADHACTLNQLAYLVARAMRVESRIVHLPKREEVRHALCAHHELKRVFGDRPQTALEQGLEVMAAWARQCGARASAPLDTIEVTKNLPREWRRD